jgi:hypothetical protein
VALVLVVESDPGQIETLRRLARTFAGHDVIFATSVPEAISAIDCRVPDLILIDPAFTTGDEAALVARLRRLPGGRNLSSLTNPPAGWPGGDRSASEHPWFYWFSQPTLRATAPSVDTRASTPTIESGRRVRTALAASMRALVFACERLFARERLAGASRTLSAIFRGLAAALRTATSAVRARAITVSRAIAAGHRRVTGKIRAVDWTERFAGIRLTTSAVARARSTQVTVVAGILVVAGIGAARSSWFGSITVGTLLHERAAAVESSAAAVAQVTGELRLTSEPSGATVVIDGRSRGVTPLTVSDLAVGAHVVTFQGSGGTVRRSVSVRAGRTDVLDAAIFSGWLALFSPIELDISEGGRALRLGEDNRLMLAPGRHQLLLVNRALGYRDTRVVDVNPGETTAVSIPLPKSIISITATPSAEVWVDGVRVGETPLVDVPVGIGTRELVFRNPALPERRQTITVTMSKTHVEVDLTKP